MEVGPKRGRKKANPPRDDVTGLLRAWSTGDKRALDALLPTVYDELRRLARAHMRRERTDHTLQTTALVNEAYLRLVEQRRVQWQSRVHFFATAANLMRRILVDHARERQAAKRGGGAARIALDEALVVAEQQAVDVIALDEALDRLATLAPRQSQLVVLRFFGGLSIAEAAEALQISAATVTREWATAKMWLKRELDRDGQAREADAPRDSGGA